MLLAVNPIFSTIAEAKRITGLAYVGNVSHSFKLMKTQKARHEFTYGIYLAPADISGHNVCPGSSEFCRAACLNMSGHGRFSYEKNTVHRARLKKTQLIRSYPVFMFDWITAEIRWFKAKAERLGYHFSVRINCTSDIDISRYRNSEGLNLLEQFPDIQFYDYTKVLSRIGQLQVYPNYDLTYSYNGLNYHKCVQALNAGVRVAVVFEKELPATYHGVEVVNGDLYDARYADPKSVIVGLVFKRVRTRIDLKSSPFVISLDDPGRDDEQSKITLKPY